MYLLATVRLRVSYLPRLPTRLTFRRPPCKFRERHPLLLRLGRLHEPRPSIVPGGTGIVQGIQEVVLPAEPLPLDHHALCR